VEIEAVIGKITQPEPYLLSLAGERLEIEAAAGKQRANNQYVAVVPIFGTITQHAGMMTDFSGGVSTEDLARTIRKLDADSSVGSIVLETASPGGGIYGVEEASDLIYSIRQAGQTRIIQHANSYAASAAVWIGSAAGQVVVTKGGEYGSIGVISQYVDESEFESGQGVKRTIVRTPQRKALFSGVEPMTEEMLEIMVQRNEQAYERFTKAVARNRGTKQAKVKSDFGQGDMMSPEEAKAVGMIDQIATLQEVLDDEVSRLNRSRSSSRARVAAAKLLQEEA
jgi:signal peptide peptidase SppA